MSADLDDEPFPTVVDLAESLKEGIAGMPDTIARAFAELVAPHLIRRLGGMYVGRRELLQIRNAAIRRDFNGRNHTEIMSRHGISYATLYRITSKKSQFQEKVKTAAP